MEKIIATATLDLVANITRPLVGTGALHQSEQQSLVEILRHHTAGKQPRNAKVIWYTLDESSEQIKLCKKTISRMVKSGELEGKYLRKGSPKTLRIKASSLDALMAKEGAAKQ